MPENAAGGPQGRRREVAVRISVGLALAAVALGLVLADHFLGSGLCLGVLTTAGLTAGAVELAKISDGAGAPASRRLLVPAVFVLTLGRFLLEELRPEWLRVVADPALVALAILLLVPGLVGVPSREKFLSIGSTALGLLYIGYLGSFMSKLRYIPIEGLGETAALFALFVSKVPDIFAYFIGRALGKRKLIPSVSPGKTVAGFVGGLLGACAVTLAFSLLTPIGTVLTPRIALPFAILFGLVSIAGDLVESLFKRSAELKDSAHLFPTFGGVLDVIDSVLLTAPVVYCSLVLVHAVTKPQA